LLPEPQSLRIVGADGSVAYSTPIIHEFNRSLSITEETWEPSITYLNKSNKQNAPSAVAQIRYLHDGSLDIEANGQLKVNMVAIDRHGKAEIAQEEDQKTLEIKQEFVNQRSREPVGWKHYHDPLILQNGNIKFYFHFGTISRQLRKRPLSVKLTWRDDADINRIQFPLEYPNVPAIRCFPREGVYTRGIDVKTKLNLQQRSQQQQQQQAPPIPPKRSKSFSSIHPESEIGTESWKKFVQFAQAMAQESLHPEMSITRVEAAHRSNYILEHATRLLRSSLEPAPAIVDFPMDD
jgi:hypothetical protein